MLTVWLLASVLTFTPFQAPEADFANLPLDQQMQFIEVIRPNPIVLPVQHSPGRVVPAVPALPPAQVEALIRQYFNEADVGWALRVSWCESRWDPAAKNPTSSASGLFQVMRGWWSGEWSAYPPFDPFDPVENTKFAAWLLYSSGAQNWNASRSCWGSF